MLGDLLDQVLETGLDRRRRVGGAFAGRHVAGRQTKVGRDDEPLALTGVLEGYAQVDKVRTKYLKPPAQFFDLLLEFAFEVRSFLKIFIAGVDIHAMRLVHR